MLLAAMESANIPQADLTLPLVGNALASFIRQKVSEECTPSAWEQYINGDTSALSEVQKRGAILFMVRRVVLLVILGT